jgi:hypothetical protein
LFDVRKADQSRKRSNGSEAKNCGYHNLGIPSHI